MKTTRVSEDNIKNISFEYLDWPADEKKIARIEEWENGEGFNIYLGEDKIELSYQELNVIIRLFSEHNLIK
jgi:hypothetical protein